MAPFANVNGTIQPAAEARISVLDRSFLFGDGVYETLRTYGGRPFLRDRHLERLSASAARIEIPLPGSFGLLAAEIQRTLEAAAHEESALRLVLTRGEGMPENDPSRCTSPPNLVILAFPLQTPPQSVYRDGTDAVVSSVRRNFSGSVDPAIKCNNLLNNILAGMDARRRGSGEAILLNPAGEIAEGSNTNVFVVHGGKLATPSLDTGILAGITREFVLELAAEAGIPVREAKLPGSSLDDADEIFLTSTTREVLPVTRLEGRPVGGGTPGPITRELHRRFRQRVREFLASPD